MTRSTPPKKELHEDLASEILARALRQSSLPVVVVSDPELRFELVSRGFARLCGDRLENLEGSPAGRLPVFKTPSLPELCLAARDASAPVRMDAIVVDASGSQNRFMLELSPIRHQGRRMFLITMQDCGAYGVDSHGLSEKQETGDRFAGPGAIEECVAGYRCLWKKMPVVVYSALPDRSCSSFYIRGRMEELTGYPDRQFMDDSHLFYKIIHPEDRRYVTRRIEAALKSKSFIDIEYRIVTRDRQIRWIRDRASPHYENGRVARIDGFMEDITQRRKAEEELRAASMLWQTTFNAMDEAVMILDTGQKILRCNRAMYDLVGLGPEKVIGRRCYQVLHCTERPISSCPCLAASKKGGRASIELCLGTRWYEITVDLQYDDHGRVNRYVHVMSDITERKKAVTALKESHQTFLTVLDSIDATIFVADLETDEVLFVNRTMKDVFGGDMIGRTCWSAFRGKSRRCSGCKELLDENGRPLGLKVWEGKNPLTNRWFINYERAIKWIDGRYVRIQVSVDITRVKTLEQERRRTEIRLRQAQKMEAIGTLAGGIAHDFNNILSAILGYAELALDDARNGKPAESYIAEIVKAGSRARDLVQQILTFSRQSETEAKPIQVKPIVKEALKLLRATLPATIEINAAIKSDAIVMADPTQIHQVIMNLCTNAGHAMRDSGGLLSVTLDEEDLDQSFTDHYPEMRPGRFLRLMVADTGHGIEPDLIDKIFDPYFTTKVKGEGTGMGLAVVQAVVQSCRGGVAVASTPGKGAVFKVYLPIVPRRAEGRVQEEPPAKGGNERILLVDDEPALVEMAGQMLERLGYRVTAATGSFQALELFREDPDGFDLVITDMTMPRMTGDVLAAELMALRPDIPVVICTGYSERISKESALAAGIKALIYKPITRKELAATVRSVLDIYPR